jgi:hypothetical protein
MATGGHAPGDGSLSVRAMAQRVWDTYVPGSRRPGVVNPALRTVDSPRSLIELIVVGSFVEVWLARDGHDSYNNQLLEKIQIRTCPRSTARCSPASTTC